MLRPSISGEVGRVSQVPQGGIPCASSKPQCYIWDPVWPPAKTHTQEHLMGLGQIWGTPLRQLFSIMYTLSQVFWTIRRVSCFGLTCLNCRTANVSDAVITKAMPLKCCVFFIMVSFSGLGSQMGWFVRAQLWSCTAEWLQIWLFSPREHHDTVPVRFPPPSCSYIPVKQIQVHLFQSWLQILTDDGFVLDCEHQRPQMPMLIWGLIVSLTRSCHTQVGFNRCGSH